jgi:hypothetical protein
MKNFHKEGFQILVVLGNWRSSLKYVCLWGNRKIRGLIGLNTCKTYNIRDVLHDGTTEHSKSSNQIIEWQNIVLQPNTFSINVLCVHSWTDLSKKLCESMPIVHE